MNPDLSKEPLLSVGIQDAPRLLATLEGSFLVQDNGRSISGPASVKLEGDGLVLETEIGVNVNGRDITILPANPSAATFVLHDVVIGRQFHWQRAESQSFRGGLRLLRTGASATAINLVGVEEYLTSVISSEMSPEGSLEFLKAHAVASRSWLLAQLELSRELKTGVRTRVPSTTESPGRLIRWYDREDHDRYDVCADDHCQRYQGTTRAYTPAVERAVRETRGLVLLSEGKVCDARFSKCCGGISERFESSWGPEPHAYLVPVRDAAGEPLPDLTVEAAAAGWIRSAPPAFCNVTDPALIPRILPKLDRETRSFYRWQVRYEQSELSSLIRQKSGIDFGAIKALVPVRRGASGRLVELMIVGTGATLTVGKDLEIRRLLSPTHLYSSAFVIDTEGEHNGLPGRFVLTGAGWGHGVGLCQIGAGMMGAHGYTCDQILSHYFPSASLATLYN